MRRGRRRLAILGATLGAIARGNRSGRLFARGRRSRNISNLLSVYLRQEADAQPLLNRVFLLYAAAKIPATAEFGMKKKVVAEIEKQQAGRRRLDPFDP